ncbi:MAG: GNAT family N-acetyltransferase [Acholeplasmataceae bacterium]
MNEYRISMITENEIDEVISVAKNVFGAGVSYLMPKKNMWGFYATDGKRIVGAVLIDKKTATEGFLSWIFVARSARGHKLASGLIEAGFDALDREGLTKQFASVRDDNTASWNMFLKRGYRILPLYQTIFGYSLKGLPMRLGYAMSTGYSIWVKDPARDHEPIYPKYPIARALVAAVFLGATLALYGLRSLDFLFVALITVVGITTLRLLIAYPIARRYGPVRFMPSQGGFILSFLIALFTSSWFPAFGFFVPKEDAWNSKYFKKNEGLQALATWLSLDAAFIFASLVVPDLFSNGLNTVLMLVIIYQMIPVFPFDGLDGAKVWRWNRIAYAIGMVVSILSLVLFF